MRVLQPLNDVREPSSRPPQAARGVVSALCAALFAAALFACARERVEVAEIGPSSGGDDAASDQPSTPLFPVVDATVDGEPFCGSPPLLGRCPGCARGYMVVDGESTCMCCE